MVIKNKFWALQIVAPILTLYLLMSEENNNNELRPSKMRGVAFPKAKYGVILAVIIIIVVNLIYYKETIWHTFRKTMGRKPSFNR